MKNLNINFNLAISLNFNNKRKCLALYITCFTMISKFVQISDIRAASYLTSECSNKHNSLCCLLYFGQKMENFTVKRPIQIKDHRVIQLDLINAKIK